MDVNSAFLHGDIDTDIYMRAPPELGLDQINLLNFGRLFTDLSNLVQFGTQRSMRSSRVWDLNNPILNLAFILILIID